MAAVAAPEGSELVEAQIGGSLWKMLVEVGDRIEKGQPIAVIEAMKAEFAVAAPRTGRITAVYGRPNQAVAPGAALAALAAE
jgi:urea carboxylase